MSRRLLRVGVRGLGLAVGAFALLHCRPLERRASLPLSGKTWIVDPTALTYDGHALALRAKLADWIAVLGPPSRSVDRAGGLRVWDALGVVAALSMHYGEADPHVETVWIALGPCAVDFWPSTLFGGEVIVDPTQTAEASASPYRFRREMRGAESLRFDRSRRLNPLASYRLTGDGRVQFVLLQREDAS